MRMIGALLGSFCILYYFIMINYAGTQATFAKVWLLMGVSLLAIVVLGIRLDKRGNSFWTLLPKACKPVVYLTVIFGILVFIVVEGFIVTGMVSKGSNDLDYIIVLGAKVKGETPSKSLVKRLECAASYLSSNPETIAILSGGQGPGEDITEAEAMRKYLVKNGINENRLLIENKSTNTNENMSFSFKLIGDKNTRTGIVTNNFHVFRGVAIGKKLGYENVEGIAADSDPVLQVNYLFREFFAVIKDKLAGNI